MLGGVAVGDFRARETSDHMNEAIRSVGEVAVDLCSVDPNNLRSGDGNGATEASATVTHVFRRSHDPTQSMALIS